MNESPNITEVTTAVQIPVDVNKSVSQNLPGPSKNQNKKSREKPKKSISTVSKISEIIPSSSKQSLSKTKEENLSPSKILENLSPIEKKCIQVRKRAKQLGKY